MVWSVWGRALIMASVMSVTAWNFCKLPLLVPEELIWQKELTAFCYDRLSFAFLQMASDIHPVINSVHIAVAVSLSWFVCAFPTLILRRLLRKRDGRQATPLLTTSPSLCTLFIFTSCSWVEVQMKTCSCLPLSFWTYVRNCSWGPFVLKSFTISQSKNYSLATYTAMPLVF